MAAAPNSHIPVLKQSALSPPFCCASRHRQWHRIRFADGHPWPRSKRSRMAVSRQLRARCAPMGPLGRGERTTEKSAGWPTGCGPVRRGAMDGPSANLVVCERTWSTWMCGRRVRGGRLSLG